MLVKQNQRNGINLGWTAPSNFDQTFTFYKKDRTSTPVKYEEAVALSIYIKGEKYLHYKRGSGGIELALSDKPVYEWYIAGGAAGEPVRPWIKTKTGVRDIKIGLYNKSKGASLIYGKSKVAERREDSVSLRWLTRVIVNKDTVNTDAMEYGVDRPGGDYKNFDLKRNDPNQCLSACMRAEACKAWTFVRPGHQGPTARCWLKNKVPAPKDAPCCISGVKQVISKPTISSFRASPTLVKPGQSVKFFWEVRNAESVRFHEGNDEIESRIELSDGSFGWPLSMTGYFLTTQPKTTTYTLVAKSREGKIIKKRLTVGMVYPPKTTGSKRACATAIQGKIAWDKKGSKKWATTNIARLCKGAETSKEPARCFNRVMHGGVGWGGGTNWQWKNAIDLCEGTKSANRTIACFKRNLMHGRKWPAAIAACSK
jgi:hypothetical protein